MRFCKYQASNTMFDNDTRRVDGNEIIGFFFNLQRQYVYVSMNLFYTPNKSYSVTTLAPCREVDLGTSTDDLQDLSVLL